MEVPKHLSHQPIIGVDDYNLMDGKYNPQKTDAQALSIGNFKILVQPGI